MIRFLLLLTVLSPAPAGAQWVCGDYRRPDAPTVPPGPSFGDPQTGYHDENFRADLVALFRLLSIRAGLTHVKLDYRIDERAIARAVDQPRPIVQISTGLRRFVRNREQLAFVLAHELGHVALGHHDRLRALWRDAKWSWDRSPESRDPYATPEEWKRRAHASLCGPFFAGVRDLEREADAYAARLVHEAGFDPEHGAMVFLQEIDLLWAAGELDAPSSHPSMQERADSVRRLSDELKGGGR
ncbi:MAG: M48 family metalloprotease [Elusimicrobia bacterium]|nr:M48 family metalloprotease [Elusimicrobiota bacterium]